jgi:hypothetical protein
VAFLAGGIDRVSPEENHELLIVERGVRRAEMPVGNDRRRRGGHVTKTPMLALGEIEAHMTGAAAGTRGRPPCRKPAALGPRKRMGPRRPARPGSPLPSRRLGPRVADTAGPSDRPDLKSRELTS